MALKPCRECGEQVSTESAHCPHCGVPHPTTSHAEQGQNWAIAILITAVIFTVGMVLLWQTIDGLLGAFFP
jgi:hypothetical protein